MARRAMGPATAQLSRAIEVAWPAERTVVCACSGGPDSLALTVVAGLSGRRHDRPVSAVVVDHGLQHGSDRVAARVVEQLAGHEITAEVLAVTVPPAPTAGGPEAAAREARYVALAKAAAVRRSVVWLGHTRDDQAETVLLGLARGSGARSLAGMPERRGPFRRPLLGIRRAVTVAACAELGLTPWHDPQNDDPAFARVRVRRSVLPTLEDQLGPGIAEALARTADQLRDDADLLDELAAAAYTDLIGTGHSLDCARLAALPPALLRRVLHRYLSARGATALTSVHLGAAARLVTDWHGQRGVDLPGLRVIRRDGWLHTVAG